VPKIDEDLNDAPVTEMARRKLNKSFNGCKFYDRCPLGAEICIPSAPELQEVTPGHTVACFKRTPNREPIY
jgi:oligopeptide/dipeptide ABC transporter ATP-binding protein